MEQRKWLVLLVAACMLWAMALPSAGIPAYGQGGSGNGYAGGSLSSDSGTSSGHHGGAGSEPGSGGAGGGRGGSGGYGGGSGGGGSVTVVVTVLGLTEDELPVNITLVREDAAQTLPTETVGDTAKVTFQTEPSGDCILYGEDVPGYLTPYEEIMLTGREPRVEVNLEYVPGNAPVEGVELNKTQTELISGTSEQLVATVLPLNANNQGVTWDSSDTSVAEVTDLGRVTAIRSGDALITVTTDEGGFTATCAVTVISIEDLIDPDPITVLRNQVVILPATVTAVMDTGPNRELPVEWSADDIEIDTSNEIQTLTATVSGELTLTGTVEGTDQTVTLELSVSEMPAVAVSGIALDESGLSLYVGESARLTANVLPAEATTKDVLWTSRDETVASVTYDGEVTAISTGLTVITAETVDGGFKARCLVSVSPVPEVELIWASEEDGAMSELFDDPRDVWINLLEATTGSPYHIKVTAKGSDEPLGTGSITFFSEPGDGDEVKYWYDEELQKYMFNLYEITGFHLMSKNSKEYFVYMSLNEDFPKDDEQTLMTNFKVGSPVPTGEIKVTKEIDGGDLDIVGIRFILCRILYEDDPDHEPYSETWEDYLNEDYPQYGNEFIDEVKMIGSTNEDGQVVWETPRESLKIGGYILLEEPQTGYTNNLDLRDPNSHDGLPYKAVHITRDGLEVRHVVNIYIGDEP